jgi:hypothetical protein
MRRSSALVLALLAVLLVGAQATTAVAAPKHKPKLAFNVEFSLPKANGFAVQVFSIGKKLGLEVAEVGHRSNFYEVPAFISEHRLRARFGALGLIDLRFKPTHVAKTGFSPGNGCHGCPLRTDRGVFTGTIRFDGENGFFGFNASRAKGRVQVSERLPGEGRFIPEEEPGEFTALDVRSKGQEFQAFAVRRPGEEGPAIFLAGAEEPRGAMRIVRGAGVLKGPASTFIVDPKAGTATVQPPFPFSGSATLANNPDGSKSWTGSLSVELLGVGPVSLIYPTFKAAIAQNVSFP